MRSTKRKKKTREAPSKEVASLIKEMAHVRTAKSAREDADEQTEENDGKRRRQSSGQAAKRHIEQYGTGTPTVRKKS